MNSIMMLEFKKILAKKDVMLILGVLIMAPLLLAFCMVNKIAGINFGGAVSMADFGILMWSFLKYLFVLYLVPIYIACSFIGKEIETRSINLMLSNQKRSNILTSKILTYVIVLTVFFALFQVISVVSYSLFIAGTEYSVVVDSSVMEIICIYAFQWLELMFVLFVSVLLCCFVKGNAALLMGLMIVILQRVLVNVDAIKRFLPYYISDYNYYSLIPSDTLATTNMTSMAIYAVILGVLVIGASRVWKTRDF